MYRRAADISASARAVTVLRTMPLHAPRVQNWIFGRRGFVSRNLSGSRGGNKVTCQQSARANRFRRVRASPREIPRLIVKKKRERPVFSGRMGQLLWRDRFPRR